jgi:hypothetical protein
MRLGGQTELSPRAQRFLSTLERRPAVPTAEVEAIITARGFPCFAPWLEFHERYAGYVLRGNDWFILGLVHRNSYWFGPNYPDVEAEIDGKTWYITCADGHPSYNYRLDNAGEFLGWPAESFDIHIERSALWWEFRQRGGVRVWSVDELRGPVGRATFERAVKQHLITEACDRFFRYYVSDAHFVVERVKTGELRLGYDRVKARRTRRCT